MTEGKRMNEPRRINDSPTDGEELAGAAPASRQPIPIVQANSGPDGKTIRAVLYYRVSTNKQDERNQIPSLREYAKFRRWTITKEYIDHGISGGKDSRPDLDLMMREIRRGRYDVLLVYSYDRFARSLRHLVVTMDELGKLGVHFASYQEQIDTTTPQGRLMFAIYAGLAEWMRHQIGQKTRETLARKKAEGMHLGRPAIPEAIKAKIRELYAAGQSYKAISKQITWLRASGKYGERKETTVSKSVVGKIINEDRPQKVRSNVA